MAGRGARLLRLIRASHSIIMQAVAGERGSSEHSERRDTVIMIIRDMLEDDIEVAIKVNIK